MKYRTGTLYDQKHAVWFEHSISLTCPLCPQLDSALHMPFWLPTHANQEYDHGETQLSMQHDFSSHQQDRLPRILLCLHGCI
jgi:hypothetical protein